METIKTERYEACFGLYLRLGGRNLSRIEREMRALGYADFNRRILYGRKEGGIYKPGWIDRFCWKDFCDAERGRRGNAERGRRGNAEKSSPPYEGGVAAVSADGVVLSAPGDVQHHLNDCNVSENHPPAEAAVPLLRKEGSRRDPDFQAWLKSVSPEMTWDWKYQQYIYKHLQRVTDGTCKRLMIFLPPRHGKSELVTVRYAGWRLWQDPKMRVIVSSYNQKLADKFSRSIRRLLSEEEDRLTTAPMSEPGAVATGLPSSPPYEGGVAAVSADGVVLSYASDVQHELTPGNVSENHPPAEAAVPLLRKEGSFLTSPANTSGIVRQPAAWPQCSTQPNNQSQIANPKSQIPQRMFPKTRTINTVSEWETAFGGGVKAVGVGAGVTGFGAQLVVIDDPVKSRAEAESETYREKLWDWYNNDLYTRLEPNASMILIQTRWHADDLAGRLLNQMKDGGDHWEVINLPALAEAAQKDKGERIKDKVGADSSVLTSSFILHPSSFSSDPLGRLPGQALCPDRYDETKLAEIQRQLGTYCFSALYQQSPTPSEGGIFKRSWFKKIVEHAPEGLKWKRGYDLAVSTKTSSCYTASFRIAYDGEGNMYIADGFRKRIEYPDQKRYIIGRVKEERDTEHGIEKAIHGQALIQELRRETRTYGRNLRGIDVTTDKVTRALKWAPLAEEGKVILVSGPWNREFLDEVCQFPGGQFDDQIDAVSLAVMMFDDKGRKMWSF